MATLPSLAPVPGDEPGFPADALEVGRILGAWGVKGAFKVQAYASDPQALFSSKRWFLQPSDRPGPKRIAPPALLRIKEAREQAGVVVASANDILDRDAADTLTGARVFVSRASFPTAGDGEYYWVDLIGLAVVNREGLLLGTVSDLIDTGVHGVLQVCAPPDEERLIPFVAAYIDKVDLAAKSITVDWQPDY
jgi:16S rRNA processing protein RimM